MQAIAILFSGFHLAWGNRRWVILLLVPLALAVEIIALPTYFYDLVSVLRGGATVATPSLLSNTCIALAVLIATFCTTLFVDVIARISFLRRTLSPADFPSARSMLHQMPLLRFGLIGLFFFLLAQIIASLFTALLTTIVAPILLPDTFGAIRWSLAYSQLTGFGVSWAFSIAAFLFLSLALPGIALNLRPRIWAYVGYALRKVHVVGPMAVVLGGLSSLIVKIFEIHLSVIAADFEISQTLTYEGYLWRYFANLALGAVASAFFMAWYLSVMSLLYRQAHDDIEQIDTSAFD